MTPPADRRGALPWRFWGAPFPWIARALRDRSRALRAAAAVSLGLGGVALMLSALATPAKAWLGQRLLERAFAEVRASNAPAKPWPWADMAPVARLDFPSLNQRRIVLDRATGEAMAWGPGHVAGTAPLGAPGLSAAAAHRDTHFALLEHLRPGDEIRLETADGSRRSYRVSHGEVVDSRKIGLPIIHEGRDVLALSTCWPFGSIQPGPMRFVLFAEPIAPLSVGDEQKI